jgi:hypothetical protein
MPGFPPLDRIYYNNPSVRVGGWIAFWLELLKSNRLNLVPGKSDISTVHVQHFPLLRDLASSLRQQHHDKCYYRGQTGRYETCYRGSIPKLTEVIRWAQEIEIAFESIIPSLFRPLKTNSSDPPDWDSYTYPSLLNQIAPAIRAIMRSRHEAIRNLLAEFIRQELTLLGFRDLAIRHGWDLRLPPEVYVPMTNVPKRLLQIISLSQHYEYQSVMVDLTGSIDVAVWFASHSWSGQVIDSVSDRMGVIYRFDQRVVNAMLEKELQSQGTAAHAIRRAGLFGLIDISEMKSEFGLRPQRQSGASLLGLENSILFALLDVYEAEGAIDVFTFPLSSVDGTETSLTKADLCPSGDPVLTVFDETGKHLDQPIQDEELITFLKDEAFSQADIEMIQRGRQMRII